MGAFMLDSVQDVRALVGHAYESDDPIAVLDGDQECLIAMSPRVFERLLFDTHILNCVDRDELCI